jgi:hypothetical protein
MATTPLALTQQNRMSDSQVTNGVLLLLFASNVFDPGGSLGLKYIAFFAAVFLSLWRLKFCSLPLRDLILGMILFVVWPSWSLLYGALRGANLSIGLAQVTPFLFAWILAVILPPLDQKAPLRAFYGCFLVLACFIGASFGFVSLFPGSSISAGIVEFLTRFHGREGYFGMRSFEDRELPNFYLASSLFLVPAFVYYLFRGKKLHALLIFLAIGLTFSKAGLLIALLFGAVHTLLFTFRAEEETHPALNGTRWNRTSSFLLSVVLIGATCVFLLLIPSFFDQLKNSSAGESETALIRIGHFHSVLGLFVDHPSYLVVGQGVGIPFYSQGESDYVQNIEIDHLNTIRKFGLPWFFGFTAIVFYSARRLIQSEDGEMRACGYALVSIYIAAGTNPVLTSPLFIISMTLAYFAQRSRFELQS